MPVYGLVPVKTRRTPPMISTGAPVTVFKLVATGNRSDSFMPRWPRMLVGTVSSWAITLVIYKEYNKPEDHL